MASATGIPARPPPSSDYFEGSAGASHQHDGEQDSEPHHAYAETSPLIGRRGDASQHEGRPSWYNLVLGTAPIAQAGILLLTLHIFGCILLAQPTPPPLFTPHPLLNISALLVLTQSLLLLQPTHTPSQKRQGALLHALLNYLSLIPFLAGLALILANKISHHATDHFESPHAILGLIVYIALVLQAFVGSTMYFVPGLYGGENNAKRVWKYHRASGYVVILLALATVMAACWTTFNVAVLGVKSWAVGVTSVAIVVGLGARVRLAKLGFGSGG